jgi:hypothetical protein
MGLCAGFHRNRWCNTFLSVKETLINSSFRTKHGGDPESICYEDGLASRIAYKSHQEGGW